MSYIQANPDFFEQADEQAAERREQWIDEVVFEQRYGAVDWIADLDGETARDLLANIWSDINSMQRNIAMSPEECLDLARDQAGIAIQRYAEKQIDEFEANNLDAEKRQQESNYG